MEDKLSKGGNYKRFKKGSKREHGNLGTENFVHPPFKISGSAPDTCNETAINTSGRIFIPHAPGLSELEGIDFSSLSGKLSQLMRLSHRRPASAQARVFTVRSHKLWK